MSFKSSPVLALIPARGGSKGITKKNLACLCGKPLLQYTIDAAHKCPQIDVVCVSSDDPDVLKLARSNRAYPLTRDKSAASDEATASDVVFDFLNNYPAIPSDSVLVYLQPTSPLRTARHIEEAFHLIEKTNNSMCVSGFIPKRSPYKAYSLTPRETLEPLFAEEMTNRNRQSLKKTFYPNGAIYIFPIKTFVELGRFPSKGAAAYIMSEQDSLDIDTEEDLRCASQALNLKLQ